MGQGHPALDGRFGDSETLCRLPDREALNSSQAVLSQPQAWSAKSAPLLPGPGQSCRHSFSNPGPFKLSYRSQDVHLQLARWRGGVNAFSQAHKGNPQHVEFVERRRPASTWLSASPSFPLALGFPLEDPFVLEIGH